MNKRLQRGRSRFTEHIIILLMVVLFPFLTAQAQYFGRNKVNYRKLEFDVLQTPHFDIYHYLTNKHSLHRIGQLAEQWYGLHQAVFKDTFRNQNPIILYNSHAEFQQTRAIEGLIGVGTGGVTEALKNRVVMPVMESNAQTSHVLGHELVHAFQYHLMGRADSLLSFQSLMNLPLWMVEGLAEYMSIGPSDPQTAIWLRSAVIHNKLPSLKDLNNKPDEYFPYRYGHAFWCFVTGYWGDTIIKPLFIATGRYGYEDAIKQVLGLDAKVFSKKWQESLRAAYAEYIKTASASPVGKELINKKNGGKMNIVPSISPDGKLIAFWSEKGLFAIDLFVADAATGRIIKKLTSNAFNTHIDEYSSYESSVAWSPDSKKVAFVGFDNGRNRLIIVDVGTGKLLKQYDIAGVPSFSNPTWSPDGNTIIISGLVNGQSDLYAFDLNKKKVTRLTNDPYSDLQPSFSPDGRWIAFATDRNTPAKDMSLARYSHNIALLDLSTGAITNFPIFAGANNLNPVFGSDHSIYFLSDRDGFRNLYSYNIDSKELVQLTNLSTGIIGITSYAPAISISVTTGALVYTYYANNSYYIYKASVEKDFKRKVVAANDVNRAAAMIPPMQRWGVNIVKASLHTNSFNTLPDTAIKPKPYRPKFQLDYIGNSGTGISTSRFGTGVAGGVNAIFSDILGYNQLYAALALNGEVYDLAGSFTFINQKRRLNWGAAVSHIPYLSGTYDILRDKLPLRSGDTIPALKSSTHLLRTFEDQISLFASYPFSQTRRIEAGSTFANYFYRLDAFNTYYDTSGIPIGQNRKKLAAPKGFNFGQAYLALVGDNAHFGIASPLAGHRYRFEISQYGGIINLRNVLADYRRYIRVAPFTIATRNVFTGRFGKDAVSGVLPPLFLGFPGLIRGYSAVGFTEQSADLPTTINDLIGSKYYVTNTELRFPFTGPERLSRFRSKYLLSELALFTDGGIAWGATKAPADIHDERSIRRSPFVVSSGVSLRINVFGYLVIEPFYAVPWQNGGFKNASWGLNFLPGW